ncbi:hypothetical protein WDU94_011204 [Cyamophila willieti]
MTQLTSLTTKHSLQNTWTLWFFENNKDKTWNENLQQVTSFETIEDFWCIFNHIKPASELRTGCDYALFKTGIRPMWEDEINKKGGRWLITSSKQDNVQLDAFWLEIILCLIGEAFGDHGEDVCGAVVNVRSKCNKIGLWTQDSSKRDGVLSIGQTIKERLRIGPGDDIIYQSHSSTASRAIPLVRGKKGSRTFQRTFSRKGR